MIDPEQLKYEGPRRLVSVLIPCYNEQESLPALYNRLSALIDSLPAFDWEVIMVNDGSTDATFAMLVNMHKRDSRWRYVDLSRNFGKETAMLAGMDYARGDCLVIMDADLQHPPEAIPEMLALWLQGHDDVYGLRRQRGKESWLRRKLSLAYYNLLQHTTRIPVLRNTGDFRLLDRICVDALTSMRESQRYTKGLYCQIGFRKASFEFDQADRDRGKSKWNFFSLLSLAVDGITSYTTSPLRIATVMGLVVSLVSFIYMIWVFVKALCYGDPQAGFPTIMTVMLFLGGVQLLTLGILGEYVGRIFNEVKKRPPYFVREVDGKRPESASGRQEKSEKD